MSYINADVPVFEAYVRNEFLYDMQRGMVSLLLSLSLVHVLVQDGQPVFM